MSEYQERLRAFAEGHDRWVNNKDQIGRQNPMPDFRITPRGDHPHSVWLELGEDAAKYPGLREHLDTNFDHMFISDMRGHMDVRPGDRELTIIKSKDRSWEEVYPALEAGLSSYFQTPVKITVPTKT